MKQVNGAADGEVDAPPQHCFRLLAAIEEYRAWHPDLIKEVNVLERDPEGHPARAHAVLHISAGPVDRTVELLVQIEAAPPDRITIRRLPEDPDDEETFELTWTLRSATDAAGQDGGGSQGTKIEVEFEAFLDIPAMIPLGGAGTLVARELVGDAKKALQIRRSARP